MTKPLFDLFLPFFISCKRTVPPFSFLKKGEKAWETVIISGKAEADGGSD